ncbi:MAG: ABC transporter ATP-binding protein [Acidobacteriaceae bacterium]|nr:ABC transporter ATP-binding protein [Acidobacteriaceae bacterium]
MSRPVDGRATVIGLDRVSKRYRRYEYRSYSLKGRVLDALQRRGGNRFHEFDALKEVSFSIRRGETVAVIGRNGAGKSTLLKILAGVVEPDTGAAVVSGRVSPLLELGAGFSPELSGRRNAYLYGALLGLRRQDIDAKLASIIDFAEIGDFMDTPVKHYSTGMYLRLAFAVAAHLEPDILLIDEVLAVGDAGFQAKCLERIEQFQRDGKTLVIVTHALPWIFELCDRALLLDHGTLLADGPLTDVSAQYDSLLANNTSAISAAQH